MKILDVTRTIVIGHRQAQGRAWVQMRSTGVVLSWLVA